MAINKVIYDGKTLMDVTRDTVTPETLAAGTTAHGASGEEIVGMMQTVTAEEWQNVVNTANNASDKVDDLEGRMDSGEFKGADGKDGTNGKDGFSPTVAVSTITNGKRISINDKNGTKIADIFNGTNGLDGAPGEDGYTPVKGVDYFTEADKAEFEAYIATELAKRGQLKPEYAESVEWLEANGDQSKMYVLPDGFIYAWKLTKTEVEGDSYTNLLPSATDTDRKTIFGGDYNGDGVNDGYIKGKRLSSSGSVTSSDNNTACCASGFISAKVGDTVRIKNLEPITNVGCYVISYNSANTKVAYKTFLIMSSTTGYFGGDWLTVDATNKLVTFELTSANFGTGFDAIRFSGLISDNTIVTINEKIEEGGGTTVVEEYKWANTNLAFVPANYGDTIADHERRIVRNTEEIAALKETVESNDSSVLTEAEKLEKIKTWDKPVYDHAEVTLIESGKEKPALTTSDRTINAIYAKYRALMAAHPDYITETNLGKCTGSSTFTAVDMLRFDFKERDGLTQPDLGESALHETKPKLIFMSGVHNEWVGVWGLYYALEEIVTNPAFDDIRRNCHIIVIPCANPYGLVKPLGEYNTPSHVNANGVAIHNNFGVGWVLRGEVGDYNYSGTEPYSELETQYIDGVVAENSDAIAFVTCHNNDYSTYYGSHVIWASSATYYMCNLAFRLVDKMSKAWINRYGQTLKDAIDEYKFNMDADDYRLGRAAMSSSAGTEQLNATKYGIQATNLEIPRMMKVFSGDVDGSSEVMTHGAEVYANFIRTVLLAYENNDKKAYYE